MFKPVPKEFDVPRLERDIIDFWHRNKIPSRYLRRNEDSTEKFRFLDGPITANGPMGVHHAWGRTYKDLWQRYNTMLGKKQRYQNGFDCQGLWVEVTVERALGFNSKRDIESYGIENFVRRCRESVFSFAALQTAQSERLGFFMDWDHSYYTLSDENNYTIWHFLKECHKRELIYRGHDVMPWCTRCATGLSEHEIATEGYQEVTHRSVYVRLPLVDRPDEWLLVWTTTPWTLTSNVAVAIHPELTYVKVRQGDYAYYVAKGVIGSIRGPSEVLSEVPGSELLGWKYHGPFDPLPAQEGAQHVVIPWDEVSEAEGTGLVHIAPGCGKEDYALGKQCDLKVIAPIDQYGVYLSGFAWLTGMNAQEVAPAIVEDLETRGLLYRAQQYTHRYPTCWRCGTELVFRLVDEWFISMDPLRGPMMEVAQKVRWIPSFGLDRELDWLRNMDDWMISKKRYWGLALPFWICPQGHFDVIGGKEELFERAVSGIEQLESPHKPWIDNVLVRCAECGQPARRVPDVGNVWLDAGIVPFSTLHYDTDLDYWREWFPADFITESFPGQFRNWFYSMLAMSTVLEDSNPFQTVLGYALMRDQDGREMHKSWGNLIPFDEAADRAGADVMRWLFALHNPEANVNFGWESLEEVKRRLLTLWNTYSFFVTYANLDHWSPEASAPDLSNRSILDRWMVARLNQVTKGVRRALDSYNAPVAAESIDAFIEDVSTWYVRRSRRRFWKSESDEDKLAAYATLYKCLATLASLTAPFMPFLSENLYLNLVGQVKPGAPASVHLTDYPAADDSLIDHDLLQAMESAKRVVTLGRAARDRAGIRVRQPLARIYVRVPDAAAQDNVVALRDLILDELNVKELVFAGADEEFLAYSVRPNLPALGQRYGKLVPGIRKALDALETSLVAQTVARGQPVTIRVGSEQVNLKPDEILTSARQREGYAAMASDGYLVALDTQLSDELVQEGWARDIVRRVNDWRKAAGFRVEERITIRYQASGELAATIRGYRDYISQETLAVSILDEPPGGSGFHAEAQFADQWLRVELQRTQ